MKIRWPSRKPASDMAQCEVCVNWKNEAKKHELAVDYWINEAARLKQASSASLNLSSEENQKRLEDLVSYWKQVAMAKEKEVVESHKIISQLRNDLEQQRVLRAEMQRRLNECGHAHRNSQKEEAK